MSSITKITTENIKGLNQEVNLSPTTVFYGGNAKGKSSLLDAMKLSLLGEHDVLGRQGKKLLSIVGGKNSAYAAVELARGDIAEWQLTPYGDTAKVECRGTQNRPSLRLSLCADEFWGKGDTARMKTLLEMCGDSSMVTKGFVKDCVERVRVTGIKSDDIAFLSQYAETCSKIIEDHDILSLSKLETIVKADKSEKYKQVKQWKTLVEADDNVLNSEEIDYKTKIAECEEEIRKCIEEITNWKANIEHAEEKERKKMQLLEKCSNEMPEENVEKLNALNEELKLIGKELKENTSLLKQYTFSKVSDDHKPEKLDECYVKGSAIWNGKNFVLVHDTVEWCKTDGNSHNEIMKAVEQLGDDAETINKLILELEQEGGGGLNSEEKQWLEDESKVNYEQVVATASEVLIECEKNLAIKKSELEDLIMQSVKQKATSENKKSYDEAQYSYKIIKKVHETIKELQDTIINSAVNSALEIINRVTNKIINEEIMWDGTELGKYTKEGDWVSVTTFSGAEKAVAQMALGVALANKAEMKIAVLDEMSRLDKKNTRQLLENMSELVEDKVVSQFIAFCLVKPTGFDAIKIEDTYKK